MAFYNTHLRKTSDPTPITKSKMERGMVVKVKYKAQGKTPKLYLILVLQPKWPNTTEGKSSQWMGMNESSSSIKVSPISMIANR